ncbi:hypothetical protein ANS017_31360 [Paraclostridium bifermentans]|nr:hypothetical protein ANS014_04750 [Paraclostridium bifermentans]GKZ05324.1 hypothetical protein ANS015_02070 [Paraclostridium bifermentans]GKZ11752.1 hypothetical protein ANS017_31360 [Paraclostridium bifermentans]
MAKELPKDNFIILSVLILFNYEPPLDKSTMYILSQNLYSLIQNKSICIYLFDN